MAETVGTLAVDITANTRSFDQGLAHAEGSLRGAQGRLGSLGGQIGQGIMQGMGVGIGLGVVGVTAQIASLGPAMIGVAMDFESAFAGVRKTVDGTEADFARLREGILGLSMSDSPVAGLENAAVQLSRIAEVSGQLGVSKEHLIEFTETIAMLEMSTNLAGDAGASMLAQFANITGMDMANIDRLGATIVDLGNKLPTTEAELVEFAHRLAGAGDQAGFTEAEILGLGAAMASVGLNAEAGGTAMTTVLGKMAKAAALGGTSLDKFAAVSKTSAKEFAETWESEPTRALTMFLEGLGELDQASQLMVLEELELDGIRVSDTLRRLSGNVALVEDAFNTANNAWEENTALTTEAGRRAETTAAQWEMLKNKVKGLGIVLGSELLPAVNDAIDGLDLLLGAGAELLGIDLNFDVSGEAPDLQAEANRIIGPVPPPIDIAVPAFLTYEVKPGDNFYSIAEQFPGVSAQDIMEANPEIAGQDYIFAGDVLQIPVPTEMQFDISGETTLSVERLNEALYGTGDAIQEIEPSKVNELATKLDELFAKQGVATDFGIAFEMIGTAFESWVTIFNSFKGFQDIITDVEKLNELARQTLDLVTPGDIGDVPLFTSDLTGDWMAQADQLWSNPPTVTIPVNANLDVLGVEAVDDLFSGVLGGQTVEIGVTTTQLEDAVSWFELLEADFEYLNDTELAIGLNGQVFTDFESLNSYIDGLPIEEGATLTFTVSQASVDTVTALGNRINGDILAKDDNPMQFHINSNVAEVAAAIDRAARDRFAEITFRITELGGQIQGSIPEFFAEGGGVAGGVPIIVGEEGPELFVPPSSGHIVPNHDLTVNSGGSGSGMSIMISHLEVHGVQDVDSLYDELSEVARQRS